MNIGASMFPALLGFDPFVSPYAAGARLLDPALEPDQSEAMANGLLFEPFHADLIERDGYTVMPAPEDGFVHPEHEWIVGHPDYFVSIFEQRAPLELKLRGIAPSAEIRTRDVLQTLVYVNVLGASHGMVSWLHGGHGGILREEEIVANDVELWAAMVDHVWALREGMLNGRLPAPDGSASTRDAIRSRFAIAAHGDTVRLTQEQWSHVRRIRELDAMIAAAKEQRERHAQVLQEAMGDATHALSPYDELALRWRNRESSRVDTTALRKAHPEIAAEFTKTTFTRPFEVNP